ncbi:biotin-dependent carboxyltransferase family protein [Nereida sp. NH-UV-3]|uniref:5-oxoprolinase subunit C family protein n=1 Tax=Nereida TaxID=282198 RepID=UPI0036F358F7
MAVAVLKVVAAGPLITVQDAGRFGHMRYGVPASGPMDRLAFAAAQVMIANRAAAAAIEVTLGGLVLECVEGEVSYAQAGGGFAGGWHVATLRAGDRLRVQAGTWGSWCYLAFAGDLARPKWLDSFATHAISGLGGGAVRTGDVLRVENAEVRSAREGSYDAPPQPNQTAPVLVTPSPQGRHFADDAAEVFLGSTYKLTDAFDRMGVRLDGPSVVLDEALGIPSEPIVRGSVQVAGDGVPTVLLADHQTTGGYPKIATVLSCETDRFAQMRSGAQVSFQAVTPEAAVAYARTVAEARVSFLDACAAPRASLDEKLMQMNLISGAVAGSEN